MRIDPGELRVRLALEEMSPTPDGAGGFAEAWTEIATVFAKLEPVAAREIASARTRRWKR